jgi:hypothetical protein
MRKFLVNTAIVLVVSIVTIVACEFALRLYFHGELRQPRYEANFYLPHATRGWALKPSYKGRLQELDFNAPFSINSKGIRGPEHAYDKDPKRFRILLVSDSAMFGTGIRDDETTPAVLEKLLGSDRFEVINFSAAAYSTVQEYVWFLEEGRKYRADLVLLGFAPVNDIQTNYLPLQKLYQRSTGRPYASIGPDGKLVVDTTESGARTERRARARDARGKVLNVLVNTTLYRIGYSLVARMRADKNVDPNVFLGWPFLTEWAMDYAQGGRTVADYEKLWSEGWAATRALILDMRDMAAEDGSKFAMFVAPAKIQGDPGFRARVQQGFPNAKIDVRKIERELLAMGTKEAIPVFDVPGPVEAAAAKLGKPIYFGTADEHWNANGHRLAAEVLAAQLKASGLLP